ncbi:MAG TPA: hypothetical protein VGB88_08410, partial [Alphaproteobacteria bacterium]
MGAPALADDAGPWRLAEAAGLPDWLSVTGTHRIRYETLDGQFRAGGKGGDQVLALRTTVLGELRFDGVRIGAELEDSRIELADKGTPLSTSLVNALELLQGYVA